MISSNTTVTEEGEEISNKQTSRGKEYNSGVGVTMHWTTQGQ